MSIEAMKQMVEALNDAHLDAGMPRPLVNKYLAALEAGRKAVAEAEKQETEAAPVAKNEGGKITWMIDDWPQNCLLYTHPQPKREPLTEREILDFWLDRFDVEGSPINNFARAIEAAHGIIKTYPEKDKT